MTYEPVPVNNILFQSGIHSFSHPLSSSCSEPLLHSPSPQRFQVPPILETMQTSIGPNEDFMVEAVEENDIYNWQ